MYRYKQVRRGDNSEYLRVSLAKIFVIVSFVSDHVALAFEFLKRVENELIARHVGSHALVVVSLPRFRFALADVRDEVPELNRVPVVRDDGEQVERSRSRHRSRVVTLHTRGIGRTFGRVVSVFEIRIVTRRFGDDDFGGGGSSVHQRHL